MKLHVKTIHKDVQEIQMNDIVHSFSTMKVLQGVCQIPKYYTNKKLFLSLALKVAVKTPNESVVESIGSVLNLHSAPNRNAKQITYHNEMVIDWNGPPLAKADRFIEKALDLHFGEKSGTSK